MADKDITAAIDRLRKTRPARAIEAMQSVGAILPGGDLARLLADVLTMLRDDLKEECRLVELAKMRGGTSIIKDRAAVVGWLELFVHQLGRESDAPKATTDEPTERLSPSPELGEHRPSDRGTEAAILPGPGGRCAVGNVHSEHTVKCPCGYERSSTEDYLSGAVDTMAFLGPLPDDGAPNWSTVETQIAAMQELDKLAAGIPFTALDTVPDEQAAHDAIDKEYAHVTADPIEQPVADPFAPIPRVQLGALTVPPGGTKWTTADLLKPIDASLLPPHLSFSQVTTVSDCGAKYRMQRVAGIPQVPQWANVGGKAFHRAVELYETRGIGYGAVETAWDDAFDDEIIETEKSSGMVRESFRASQQGKEGYDWWRVEGAAMLQRYVDWRTDEHGANQRVLDGPSGAPMLEWETTYDVDGVPFTTILDSVWTDGAEGGLVMSRTAVIRDWKTGSGTPDDRQLCTQAWGLRKAGWTGPVLVQFFDARRGTFTEPFDPFERMSWDDVRYFVLSADAQRKMPILPARPSDFCGGCSVAYACPIMSQRRIKK